MPWIFSFTKLHYDEGQISIGQNEKYFFTSLQPTETGPLAYFIDVRLLFKFKHDYITYSTDFKNRSGGNTLHLLGQMLEAWASSLIPHRSKLVCLLMLMLEVAFFSFMQKSYSRWTMFYLSSDSNNRAKPYVEIYQGSFESQAKIESENNNCWNFWTQTSEPTTTRKLNEYRTEFENFRFSGN